MSADGIRLDGEWWRIQITERDAEIANLHEEIGLSVKLREALEAQNEELLAKMELVYRYLMSGTIDEARRLAQSCVASSRERAS